MVLHTAAVAEQMWKCGAVVRLTESSLSEWTHSSDTASEPRKTRRASSGKPPSPGESATKTAEGERGSQFCTSVLILAIVTVFAVSG